MLQNLLKEDAVALNQEGDSWEAAIHIAGDILVRTGKCKKSYVEAMVEAVKKYGPYIVIEDGIAMPHAKSDSDVYEDGLAIVTLKNPVDFHNPEFEKVSVLFAICSANPEAHLNFLQELSSVFEAENIVEKLCACQERTELLAIIKDSIA